jgi:hypothetical protein
MTMFFFFERQIYIIKNQVSVQDGQRSVKEKQYMTTFHLTEQLQLPRNPSLSVPHLLYKYRLPFSFVPLLISAIQNHSLSFSNHFSSSQIFVVSFSSGFAITELILVYQLLN